MEKNLENFKKKAKSNNLSLMGLTGSSTGYPSPDLGWFAHGFNNFDQAKKFAEDTGGSLAIGEWKDGWGYAHYLGEAYEPFKTPDSSWYGNNYEILYTPLTKDDFWDHIGIGYSSEEEYNKYERDEESKEKLEGLKESFNDLLSDLDDIDWENQYAVLREGKYYDTIDRNPIYFYHDTKNQSIGVAWLWDEHEEDEDDKSNNGMKKGGIISRSKAKKILHEGKAHGKPLTEKQRKFFGARASGYPPVYSEGGELQEIYSKGTAKQLWQAWNNRQRSHFITDHADMFMEMMGNDFNFSVKEFAGMDYDKLPMEIRKEVVIHHAMGIYDKGGPIGSRQSAIGKGGRIPNNYKGKTPETVWNMWTPGQRVHFIADHEVLAPFKKQGNDVSHKKWAELPDNVEGVYIKGVIMNHIDSGQYPHGGRINPMKKKTEQRIEKIKKAMPSASEKARAAMQKKIDKLQAELDHNPSLKERVAEGKGKFSIDIPALHAKKVYMQLWNEDIFPQVKKINGTMLLIVNNRSNLNKAYAIYSGILKEKGISVPDISSISRNI